VMTFSFFFDDFSFMTVVCTEHFFSPQRHEVHKGF